MNSLLQQLQIALQKLHNLLVQQSTQTQESSVPTTFIKTMIQKWADSIIHWEGHFDGNLKFTTLTKSWGASIGRPATDGGHFCVWKDEATGYKALCNFLTLACEGELIIAHHPCTLEQFTIRFAGNPPQGYINGIATMLGVSLTTDISTFLS